MSKAVGWVSSRFSVSARENMTEVCERGRKEWVEAGRKKGKNGAEERQERVMSRNTHS